MSDSVVIDVNDLHVSFFTKKRRVDVLKGLSLGVQDGERLAITGGSGAGKSTLLYCLAGLLLPSSGTVTCCGLDLAALDEQARASYRLYRVGIVYQAFHLLGSLDAAANVALPMRLAGVPRPEAGKRAAELLDRVGLSDRAQHRPAQLSGGEQQRVAVARAVANNPDILLADEPTGNLDDESAQDVLGLLTDRELGPRVLVVATHDPRVAERLDRRVAVANGRLASPGSATGPDTPPDGT